MEKYTEHDMQNQIRNAISKLRAAVMFRANVGMAWAGSIVSRVGSKVTLGNAHPLNTGLPKGFPDLFGYKTVTVTPEMVGKKIAVFAFVEVKTDKGRISEHQKRMHEILIEGGAIGGVARSVDDALKILEGGGDK